MFEITSKSKPILLKKADVCLAGIYFFLFLDIKLLFSYCLNVFAYKIFS